MISCSCGADTRVTETRATPAGARRRRACVRCDEKFTTYELRVPARFGNSISGRGHLVIVGEADVNRLRAALGKMLESIEMPNRMTPLLPPTEPPAASWPSDMIRGKETTE